MQVRAEQITEGGSPCGCGRSPTGRCIGWHGLTEDQYWVRLNEYYKKSMGDHAGERFVQDPNLAINIREIYG